MADAHGKRPGRRRRSPVFVDRAEVKEALGLASNSSLDLWIGRGWCPPPCRWLTPRRPVWHRPSWERWLLARFRAVEVPPDARGDAAVGEAEIAAGGTIPSTPAIPPLSGIPDGRRRPRRSSKVFVTRPELKRMVGTTSNAVLANLVDEGRLPPPDRWLNPSKPAWYRESLERWIQFKGLPAVG